ncbi:MAG: DciA family protein [Thiotrichales bacterium]
MPTRNDGFLTIMQRSADWLPRQVLQQLQRSERLKRQVIDCLQPPLSDQVQSVNYSDGCLSILVTDHSWSTNLLFHQRELIRRMAERHAIEISTVRAHAKPGPTPRPLVQNENTEVTAMRRRTSAFLRTLSARLASPPK